MIKANELRIGNRVLYFGKLLIVQAEDFANLNWEKVEPISLTEKSLQRMGFESNASTPFCRIDLPIGIGQLSVNPDNGTAWLHKNGNSNNPADVQYVHQLQNLFFALSGEELKIDL